MAPATTTSAAIAAALLCLCASAFPAAHPTDGRPVAGGHHHQGTKVETDIVAEACANATRLSYVPQLTMEYCVSTLRADRRSAAATQARDLALVAMDLLQLSAADADAWLATVPEGDRKGDTALTVHFCRLDYGAVARTVPECRPMVQGYKPGEDGNLGFYNYMEYGTWLSEAALDCWENIFFDEKLKEKALNQVQEAANRANLVGAMIEQMVGILDGHSRD
ncbi:hypothetical protein C2845_PM06G29550 [Panicum miliaceum]|uniref:Uncharacterized protein n=1 Tax=Panicum miliaceum TaxID=4540 RepID=A0A3L6RFX5_PANMI|nr:hypothetical protein C2845_PM06G29550 [Panicum miliaceum]